MFVSVDWDTVSRSGKGALHPLLIGQTEFKTGATVTFQAFKWDKTGFKISLPFSFAKDLLLGTPCGRQKFSDWKLNNGPVNYAFCKKLGHSKEVDLNHAKANPAQKTVVSKLLESYRTKDRVTLIAGTGVGKTAISLKVAQQLNTKTLIIVDRNILVDQWTKEVEAKCGLKLLRITSSTKPEEVEKSSIAITTVQYLMREETVLDGFGFCVVDEADAMTAEKVHHAFASCTAEKWLAMTATFEPTKKDQHRLVTLWCGEELVRAVNPPEELTVYDVNTGWFLQVMEPLHRMDKSICNARQRNELLFAKALRAAEKGRYVFVCAKLVDHLDYFKEYLLDNGVLLDDILSIYDSASRKIKVDETKKYRFVLGSFAAATRGVSIDYLDCGINLAPMSNPVQIMGRVRRPHPDKKPAIWIYPLDEGRYAHYKRLKVRDSLLATNAVWEA